MSKLSSRETVRYALWVYLLLLLFEGALRKWFLTPLSDVLLISRVPVTLFIYFIALQAGFFTVNGFVTSAIMLSVLTFPLALMSHGSVVVAIFGLIANFLSIPLIFIIPRVIDYQEAEKIGRFLLYCVIPMTLIICLQFYSPQTAWINRSVGGTEGGGFYGALDKFRPPGTFSFITGVAQYYTLSFTFFLAQFVNQRTLPQWFLYLIGVAFVMAIYGSISRLLALSVLLVFAFCIVGMVINGRKLNRSVRIITAFLVIFGIASQFSYFQDGMEAFKARWEFTQKDGKSVDEEISNRILADLTQPFTGMDWTEPLGMGLGAGTNVGARFLVGKQAFLAGEGEWSRLVVELGPIFGFAFIVFRVALTVYIGNYAFRKLKTGNLLPWFLFGSAFFLLLSGQWSQQTTLGFTVFSAGLILASGNVTRPQAKPMKAAAPKQKMSTKTTAPMMS